MKLGSLKGYEFLLYPIYLKTKIYFFVSVNEPGPNSALCFCSSGAGPKNYLNRTKDLRDLIRNPRWNKGVWLSTTCKAFSWPLLVHRRVKFFYASRTNTAARRRESWYRNVKKALDKGTLPQVFKWRQIMWQRRIHPRPRHAYLKQTSGLSFITNSESIILQ